MIERIELLGIQTWETVWLPVIIWTVPAAFVWLGVRSDRFSPGLRLQIVQATLLALPVAVVAAFVRHATKTIEYVILSVPAPASLPPTTLVEQTITRSVDPIWTAVGVLTITAVAAAVWGVVRLAVSSGALMRLRARSRPLDDQHSEQLLRRHAEHLGFRREVGIRSASGISTPMSAGIFNPVIFVPEEHPVNLDLILLHELIHHRRRDVARMLTARIIRAAFFIHPLVHALNKRLDMLIEIDCDNAVISTDGVSRKAYASLLLRYAAQRPSEQFALKLSSEQSLVRKRLEAMQHPSSSLKSHPIAVVLGLVLLGAVTMLAACTDSSVGTADQSEPAESAESAQVTRPSTISPMTDLAEKDVFVIVEEMPELIGGLEALHAKIDYPDLARRAGVEGRVYVQFIVTEDGVPRDIIVTRGIGSGADEEAVRAVAEMRFTPGRQRGRIVPVKMSLPVEFALDGRQLEDEPVSIVTRSGLTKMSGRVVNSAGQPVPFATIQLEGTVRGAATDENGNYFVLAEPGTYDVRVVYQGSKERIEDVRLQQGVTKHLDVTLQH